MPPPSQKTTQEGTATTTLDQNTQNKYDTLWQLGLQEATRGYQPYGGTRVAEFSPDQMSAMQYWRDNGLAGMGLLGQAAGIAGQLYTPQQVAAAQANAASVNRGDIRDVASQNVGVDPYGAAQFQQQVGGFMNPYTDAVVNQSLQDIERFRGLGLNQGQAAATAAGAFGGARHGIADAETNRAALEQAARTAGQLRSAGFESAAGRAQQAGLMGQRLGLQAALANQGAALQAALANQGVDLSTGLANAQFSQQANMMNAQLAQQAAMANQAAGLQARGLDLQGAGLLGRFGQQQQGMAANYAQGLLGQGNMQQARQQAMLDAAYQEHLNAQNWRRQGIMALPGFIGGGGQTSTFGQTGSQYSPWTPANFLSGWWGGVTDAASRAAAYGG